MNAGVVMIAAERQRQVTVEGWSTSHDDEHDPGTLALAARGYLVRAMQQLEGIEPTSPARWPWAAEWWKPAPEPLRNLVKAGALIAAEIDRIVRQQLAEEPTEVPCGVHVLCGREAVAVVVGESTVLPVCDHHRRGYLASELEPIGPRQ